MKSSFFSPPSCCLGSKLPLLPPSRSFFDVTLSEQREERREQAFFSGRLGSSWLMLLPRSGAGHGGAADPYRAPDGIYIPCLCVMTSHTLHSLSPLTYADRASKARPCTKARKHLFVGQNLYISPPVNSTEFAENIRPRITRQRRKKEKKFIKINNIFRHSFTDKQQLHRMGNHYYLCDRKTIRHREVLRVSQLECSASLHPHSLNVELNHLFFHKKPLKANSFLSIFSIGAKTCT